MDLRKLIKNIFYGLGRFISFLAVLSAELMRGFNEEEKKPVKKKRKKRRSKK